MTRASIIQAKHTSLGERIWDLDSGQFFLMHSWPPFAIIRPKPVVPRIYILKPKTSTWATYGLCGTKATKYPIYLTSRRLMPVYTSLSRRNFSLSLESNHHKMLNCTHTGWDYSTSFLMKFLQGFIGERVETNRQIRRLVEDLYEMAKLSPESSLDFNWMIDDDDREKGFGIIELTIREKEED